MGHLYLSHSHPIAIYACHIPSLPMGRFPWDSHRNPIPMDKPGIITVSSFFIPVGAQLTKITAPTYLLFFVRFKFCKVAFVLGDRFATRKFQRAL